MTDREWARLCIRGGCWTLAGILAVLLGWWLGMKAYLWVAG